MVAAVVIILLLVPLMEWCSCRIPARASQPAASPVKQQKPLGKPEQVTRLGSGRIELCLACHSETPDRFHSRKAVGCWNCHLGNPLAGTPELAHKGMVLNPGELSVVHKTCGKSGCHPAQTEKVKRSLMATNRGIIDTLRYYWKEIPAPNYTKPGVSVKELMDTGQNSPALDYYRKLCGTCHLWLPRHKYPGFLGEKGGGCTACHHAPEGYGDNAPQTQNQSKSISRTENRASHPWITRKFPIQNCVRCHNRSGRIGLSYQGLYESEGYGTPYQHGELNDETLGDGRFIWTGLPPDLHHQAGMVCIDCHTQDEVMGDGKDHSRMEQQIQIECATCHRSQKQLQLLLQESKKDEPAPPLISNLGKDTSGRIILRTKLDGRALRLQEPKRDICNDRLHRRLSCQACHSPWVPQCYGCHVRMDGSQKQLDKLSGRKTPGNWQEFRSFIRYESPTLGVSQGHTEHQQDEIVILVPG